MVNCAGICYTWQENVFGLNGVAGAGSDDGEQEGYVRIGDGVCHILATW